MSSAFFFSDYFLIFIYFHPFIDFKVFFSKHFKFYFGALCRNFEFSSSACIVIKRYLNYALPYREIRFQITVLHKLNQASCVI